MSREATTSQSVADSPGKTNWPFICFGGGLIFLAVAIFGAISGALNHDPRPVYGLLVMFTFYLSIGLGMLLLTMIHHVFGAGWSTVPRRQVEHATSIFPILGGVFLVFLIITYFIDNSLIWKWIDFEKVKDDVLYVKKSWYLNDTRFLIGVIICFGGWIFLSNRMRSYSAAQDKDGDVKWTNKLVWWSAVGVIFTALTLSMAAIDWIKSLEFHWFSTMFGVWFFAASMRAALAVTTLVCLYQVYKNGPLTGLFKRGHLYDLGCITLAFTVFWAYISFSQYFLIYNANIPEETFWYNMREQGAWWWVSMGLIFGHFLFTFIFLLFYANKVKASRMIFISVWILCFHMLDLYFNILPSNRLDYEMFISYPFYITVWDVAAFLGIGGLCAWSFMRSWTKTQVIPVKDPRISESLHHHGR